MPSKIYTPTTDQVASAYAQWTSGWSTSGYTTEKEAAEEFKRWLEAHDREIKAEALREAADDCWEGYETTDNRGVAIWLRRRAQQLTEQS